MREIKISIELFLPMNGKLNNDLTMWYLSHQDVVDSELDVEIIRL